MCQHLFSFDLSNAKYLTYNESSAVMFLLPNMYLYNLQALLSHLMLQ